MAPGVVARQNSASSRTQKQAIAGQRAKLLLSAMSLDQKLQQLTGSMPEVLQELPDCYGGRHVNGIPSLSIPTFRITNGPVGLGQNDCVALSLRDAVAAKTASPFAAYTDPSSAHATALPSAMSVAASFDPGVATAFGNVIATEMNNLALHVFEAPGVNLARLPILGRNFEYFGEDPLLAGTMASAETREIQSRGLIAMVKHFAANEQETNRKTIEETVDRQVLHELYLLPFEMAVRDGGASAVMCAYNYVNGVSSCESHELLTDVLRKEWGFTGYVQSDFFAMKTTTATLKAGMDHEMPTPLFWAPDKLKPELAAGSLSVRQIDQALQRRYTQMFLAGIFDRRLVQTPIDFAAGAGKARWIGTHAAVLLQNNGALPLSTQSRTLVLIGKASQPFAQQAIAGGSMTGKPMGAGGGSSDVVPENTVSPAAGLRRALDASGATSTKIRLVLVDDSNLTATIDGQAATFATAIAETAAADEVVLMAGTIAEEGADRATFVDGSGASLVGSAADGASLDWYTGAPSRISTANQAKSSQTVAMIKAVLEAASTTPRSMSQKTVLVLKDNASIAVDPELVGPKGPAILEVWFPGQEDGDIVGDLLVGKENPSGKLPVTFPMAGSGFLNGASAKQYPGVPGADGKTLTVTYDEKLGVGYRWYDANVSGKCALVKGRNPCIAFPFGHGLSYTSFKLAPPKVTFNARAGTYEASTTVTNTGKIAGAEVVQTYLSLPQSASIGRAAQPPKRFVGFKKVILSPGASATVVIRIDPAASSHPLGVWDPKTARWTIAKGRYDVLVGTSSSPADLRSAGTITR